MNQSIAWGRAGAGRRAGRRAAAAAQPAGGAACLTDHYVMPECGTTTALSECPSVPECPRPPAYHDLPRKRCTRGPGRPAWLAC